MTPEVIKARGALVRAIQATNDASACLDQDQRKVDASRERLDRAKLVEADALAALNAALDPTA